MQAITVFNNWVDQYLNFEKQPQKNIFWLNTMEYLANRFNNPQNSCPCIHVAGSKGKGSISTMIANILNEAGYKTGLYTSPHIINLVERVSGINGPFDEDVYEKSVKEIMNGVNSIIPEDLPGKRPITWFELVTLFGMICFKNAKTDWSVYEVGLGGRLDATNIVKPKCCCIGPIELEHVQYLGDTVEKIANEKGGIIKEGVPVVIASQKESVKEVFKKIAEEKKSKVIFADENAVIKKINYIVKNNTIGMEIEVVSPYFKRPIHTVLNLLGDFQAENAVIAALTAKIIYPEIDESIIEKGLQKAILPGRFEVVRNIQSYDGIPEIILDGAHTVNSIHFTINTFEKLYENTEDKSANLLFGCAEDKDVEDIASFFKDRFNSVMLTKPGSVKACDLPRIEKAFDCCKIEYVSCGDYYKAIEAALKKANEQKVPLLVTGSFYLVAEVKKFLMAKKCFKTL